MSESRLEPSSGDGGGRPVEKLVLLCLAFWVQPESPLLFLSFYYVPSPQRGVMGEKSCQRHDPCLQITGNQSNWGDQSTISDLRPEGAD